MIIDQERNVPTNISSYIMKKLLLIVLLASLSIVANAQDEQNEKSKNQVDEFLAKDGVLRTKEFYPLGSVGDVKFENLIVRDVVSGKKIGVLTVETSNYSSVETERYIGSLDVDEIDGCIKSLKYIKDIVAQTPPRTVTEFEYETKDGVRFGCYNKTDKKGAGYWVLYIKTKKYISRSSELLPLEKINDVIAIFEKAKLELAAKL